jgi:hypothetical protein
MEVRDEEYQKAYDAAAAELEAAAQATTARGPDGKFAKAEPAKVETPEPTPTPTPEPTPEPTPAPVKDEKPADELAELRARLEKAEKIAKDNQAWATKLAQERAAEKREREQREREANKPAILDANPGLDEAIRYVAQAPAKEAEADPQAVWASAVEKAHPGIFTSQLDPELEQGIVARLSALDEASKQDPLVAIREITAEKLAFGERQVGKRFAAESAKLKEKTAMSVPGAGAGSGAKAPVDAQLAEVQRIQGMSDADFQKEVRRVKGL